MDYYYLFNGRTLYRRPALVREGISKYQAIAHRAYPDKISSSRKWSRLEKMQHLPWITKIDRTNSPNSLLISVSSRWRKQEKTGKWKKVNDPTLFEKAKKIRLKLKVRLYAAEAGPLLLAGGAYLYHKRGRSTTGTAAETTGETTAGTATGKEFNYNELIVKAKSKNIEHIIELIEVLKSLEELQEKKKIKVSQQGILKGEFCKAVYIYTKNYLDKMEESGTDQYAHFIDFLLRYIPLQKMVPPVCHNNALVPDALAMIMDTERPLSTTPMSTLLARIIEYHTTKKNNEVVARDILQKLRKVWMISEDGSLPVFDDLPVFNAFFRNLPT